MDLSTQYKQMCKQSPEIQGMCKHEFGDFTWIESLNKLSLTNYPNLNDPDRLEYIKTNCVWLPRQDQLQTMIFSRCLAQKLIPLHFARSFYIWLDEKYNLNHGYGIMFDTMEKSWLAYVMEVYYNKQWNGKEWVKA